MTAIRATETCAIVVTFHPDITPLLTMLGQLDRETNFLVVDNGSPSIEQLEESITVYGKCLGIIKREQNEGLARALNIGISRAREEGFRYIFMFDQDSSLCESYIERMVAAYREVLEHSGRGIAAIGPRIINPQTSPPDAFQVVQPPLASHRPALRTQRFPFHRRFPDHFRHHAHRPAPAGNRPDAGGLFHRQRRSRMVFPRPGEGFDLVGTNNAILYHLIGERSLNPLVRAGIMAQHKPSRTYYSSRNRIHLYTRSYSPIGWKARD